MGDVKAVILDENFFQVYDNLNKMTENYIGSGLYWNYWYHTWKTVSVSPFANAIVFALSSATTTLPASVDVTITDKSVSEIATTLSFVADDADTLSPSNLKFVQTNALVDDGIAVHPFGAVMIPYDKLEEEITLNATINGQLYVASTAITGASEVGDTVTLAKSV